MYEILSFPSDIEAADGVIRHTWDHAALPPDYEEGFEERAFQYAQLGLKAYELAKKLRDAYQIPPRDYNNWDPVSELKSDLEKIKTRREAHAQSMQNFISDRKAANEEDKTAADKVEG